MDSRPRALHTAAARRHSHMTCHMRHAVLCALWTRPVVRVRCPHPVGVRRGARPRAMARAATIVHSPLTHVLKPYDYFTCTCNVEEEEERREEVHNGTEGAAGDRLVGGVHISIHRPPTPPAVATKSWGGSDPPPSSCH